VLHQAGWKEQVSQIAGDRESGASVLARACASALIAYVEQSLPATLGEMREDLLAIADDILSGQPSMAPLVQILNRAVLAVGQSRALDAAVAALRRVCLDFVALVDQAAQGIAEAALGVLPSTGTVLTLSYSTAVAKALTFAEQRGHSLRIICLESRPNLEGRAMAAHLAEHGLDVVLMVDAAVFEALRVADLFLVGADSLTVAGVVNKIGTACVAASAQVLGKPGYAAADTTKVWPAGLGLPPIADHPAGEVWPDVPHRVAVRNPYFDLAPWSGFAGVVTERGVLGEQEVIALCQGGPVEDAIRQLLASR
jgi:methylthioribose-1-phosphate isomerase